MADRFVTPEELASALQKDLDRSTSEILIEGATAVVQALVGQRLVRASSTVHLEPPYGGLIRLPERPVVSVESVTINGVELETSDYQVVGNDLFRYSGWRSHSFGGFASPVSVEYTHGYLAGDQMLELARSTTITIAAQAYANPDRVSQERVGDVSMTFEAAQSVLDASPFLRAALLRRYGGGASMITLGRAQ